jgi:hypothetical protein
MKQGKLVTPITIKDFSLFRKFKNGYKNTLTYNAQAVNGWNPKGESKHRLGLKYYDGDNLLTIGHFQRNGSKHFHLIPCESSIQKIKELAKILFEISGSSVYIKKIGKEQRDTLLIASAFFEVNEDDGWSENAPLEDDTHPEQIIDSETILEELDKTRKQSQVKDTYVRAIKRYVDSGRLKVEYYDSTNTRQRKDALRIVQKFFDIQEERKNNLSVPEDYFNIVNLKPAGVDYFSSIFYVDEKPAAFYFAERAEEIVHVYANLTLRDEFRYLSEFILIHLLQEAFKKGVKKANLGGSETKGLDDFKRKFKPIGQNKMYWLLFKPTQQQ